MEDRRNAAITDVDFTGARFRGVDLTDVAITDAWVHGVSISGDVTALEVNGVDVTGFVEAELDRRHPVRVLLRSEEPDELRAAWSAIEQQAADTVAAARRLPSELLDERAPEVAALIEADWCEFGGVGGDRWYAARDLGVC